MVQNRLIRSNFDFNLGFKIPDIERPLFLGRFEEAVTAAVQLLRDRPDNYAAWRLLYEAYTGTQDFKNALYAIERARALRPDNFHYQKLYAVCLKELGEYRRAIELLDDLRRKMSDDILLIDALKVCHFRVGDEQRARSFGALKLTILAQSLSDGFDVTLPQPPQIMEGGKSVVSFTIWGRQERYCVGAMVNARLVKTLMPNWTARFYVGKDVPHNVIDDLRIQHAEIILDTDIPSFVPSYMARFLVADDPKVARFVCRDCDSRITVKDAAAVSEWVASSYRYHIMRDHIFHSDLILAGLWGGIPDAKLPMADLIRAFQEASRGDRRYGGDQLFLGSIIWPRIHKDALTHDSYYRVGETRLFPIGGKGSDLDHVGIGVIGAEQIAADARKHGIAT